MRDGALDRETGLTNFRRYTWWAVPGTAALQLVFFVGDWLLDPDVPLGARVAGTLALAVTTVASVVLLSRRLSLPFDASPGGPSPTDPQPPGGPPSLSDPQPPGGPAAGSLDAEIPPPAPSARWLVAGCAGALVLAVIPLAVRNYGLWAVPPATMVAIIATYLPPARRRRLIASAVAAAPLPGGAVSLWSGDGELMYAALFPPGLVAFVAWITLGPLWAWDIAGRLSRARRLSADLAVKDERLRFAADLHDIQGHHLQVIALKSELAARLAEVDPARAAAEMREVQRLSIDALQDTRAVVQGYRSTTLDGEIANATRVLAAADIDARMNIDPAAGPGEGATGHGEGAAGPERGTAAPGRGAAGPGEGAAGPGKGPAGPHLLGLVMREATTNVLRHSRARHAEVDYRVAAGVARLRISNDGVLDHPGTSARKGAVGPASAGPGGGSGLRTLGERLRAAGGELVWERDGDRFVVVASLPAGAEVEVP